MKIKTYLANNKNYGSKRDTKNIKYIVIHYTGNDGDSDEGNSKYFKNNIIKASAHYFVDEDSVTQSVPDNYVAYSVGGSRYSDYKTTGGAKFYEKCNNSNSISVELCDSVKNGKVYPNKKTIDNAIELVKDLMKKYNVRASNVIRHFDVNGKKCPAYWCGNKKKNDLWESEFKDKLTAKKTTTKKSAASAGYRVEITTDVLKIRKGAGTDFGTNGSVREGQIYTIVDEKYNGMTKWGKLKSGAGWISLKYTKKI